MTELTNLSVATDAVDPLFSPAAPSPEFLLVDEESASTYPLLTPSPPAEFDHPLALNSNGVHAYERQLSPDSIDIELNSLPTIGGETGAAGTSNFEKMAATDKPKGPEKGPIPPLGSALETRSNGMGSSSSSSSVLQDATASAQLLNPHHYHNLAGDVTCQENGGIKPVLCGLQLGLRKTAQDFYFVKWNWPLIRRFCFWSVMSLMVACVCVVIASITTLPKQCDPPRAWYHGSLFYEIFPASFKDSDGDGIGDLRGVAAKCDYLRSLGVQGVRLNAIFPSEHFPEHFDAVDNLTRVEETLGSMDDFRALVRTLHARNMSLMLDVPLYPLFKELNGGGESATKAAARKQEAGAGVVTHVIVNNHILNGNLNRTDFGGALRPNANAGGGGGGRAVEGSAVARVLEFWLREGVDGFYLKGLERYVADDSFAVEIKGWRRLLHRFNNPSGFDKILICSVDVVTALEKEARSPDADARLSTVLTHFSLVDVYIESMASLGDLLAYVQKGVLRSSPAYPWVMWTSGGIDAPRLASRLNTRNESLAALAVQMMLPGTPCLFYGDELGLDNIDDPNGERSDISHAHGLAPMKWPSSGGGEGGRGFTRPLMLPWMPDAAAHGPPEGPKVVSVLSALRENNPSIYMHAIWKDRQLVSNCAIRYSDQNLILMERSYPRRYSYAILANLGDKYKNRDLSKIFYGGKVVLDQNGKSGKFVTFHNLGLHQGEFLLIKLDK